MHGTRGNVVRTVGPSVFIVVLSHVALLASHLASQLASVPHMPASVPHMPGIFSMLPGPSYLFVAFSDRFCNLLTFPAETPKTFHNVCECIKQ